MAITNNASSQQMGFTLIELIMVIVILGILSAFALPKFADLSGNAQSASIQGALGAVRAGSAIAHAQWLADGSSTSTSVSLEGVPITMVVPGGYPDQDVLDTLTDLTGYYVNEASAATIIALENAAGSQCFSYTNGAPPAISVLSTLDVKVDTDPSDDTCP